jgi:hypothetical protein
MAKQAVPTARDLALFRTVGERGLVNLETVHRLFWAGRTVQTCQGRLTHLVQGGYLQNTVTDARGKAEHIYWLGRKVARLFSAAERASFVQGRPAQAEIAHVLTTWDVIERLQKKYTVTSVLNERALKGVHKKGASVALADGQLCLDGVEHLLEIDSPHYTGQRLQKKMAGFAKSGIPTLWVVRGAARLNTVSQAASGCPRICVVEMDAL